MGVILELARARQRISELEGIVAKLEARLTPPEPPTIKGIISSIVILNLFGAIFPNQQDKIFISDLHYEITAISEIRRFIDWDNTNLFPYVAEIHDCEILPDVAYGLGLFFTDGSCGLRRDRSAGAWWRIVNRKLDDLIKVQTAFNQEYERFGIHFPLRLYDSYKQGQRTNLGERKSTLYCLEVAPLHRHNDGTRGEFIRKFRTTMYNRFSEKKVPAGIIESPALSKREFLMGVIAGGGSPMGATKGQISCFGWQTVGGLMDLMLDNNWSFNWGQDKRNPQNYILYYNYKNESPKVNPACDDFALALAGDFAKYPGWSGFPVSFIWGSYYGGHAFAACVAWRSFEDRTSTVYFIEPQTDWEIAIESVEGTKLWLLPMRKVGGVKCGGYAR